MLALLTMVPTQESTLQDDAATTSKTTLPAPLVATFPPVTAFAPVPILYTTLLFTASYSAWSSPAASVLPTPDIFKLPGT